jgi:hypothetical protein
MSQDEKFNDSVNKKVGWVWEDKILTEEFESFKSPDTKSITTILTNLQCFFLMYFGEISSPVNPGGLFCQIIATSPHFNDEKSQLIKFNPAGKTDICSYTPISDVDKVIERFLASDGPTSQDQDQDIIPSAPEQDARLVGTSEGPEFATGSGEATKLTAQDVVETGLFRQAVIVAFKTLKTNSTDMATSKSYRSFHLTAVFLILVMMRRITKKPIDLVTAFSRGNIHRHYTDMVPEPFGTVLPPPASSLNHVIEQALSANTQSGRHMGTLVLYMMYSNTVTLADKPVGYLGQANLGLESILRATCMTHIAGSGLPLVTLFVILKTVYNKTERETIEWLAYQELSGGLMKIVNLRSVQFQKQQKESASFKLFPYCRLIHSNYHLELGHRGNENLCYLMACLIDEKLPPASGTGGAKGAEWAKSLNTKIKNEIQKVAYKMFELLFVR